MEECGMDSCVSRQGHSDGWCEHGCKILDSTDGGNLLTGGVITLSFSRRDYLVENLFIYLQSGGLTDQ